MMTVCAWCDRFLGPDNGEITHGICGACTARQHWRDVPVLVVAAHRQELVPVIEELLRGHPELRIVVDRRRDRRRRQAGTQAGVERRSGADRRRQPDLYLG